MIVHDNLTALGLYNDWQEQDQVSGETVYALLAHAAGKRLGKGGVLAARAIDEFILTDEPDTDALCAVIAVTALAPGNAISAPDTIATAAQTAIAASRAATIAPDADVKAALVALFSAEP